MSTPLYIALVHYPIQNRLGETVATSVTNLDIHDLSRTARTYGAKAYFIVTPVEEQHEVVGRILAHWKHEDQLKYHPDRFEAFKGVRLIKSFEEVVAAIEGETGERPEVVLTDARPRPQTISYADYRKEIEAPSRKRPILLIFGTGWGLAESFFTHADRVLAPVVGPEGPQGYNHLSVRAAAAVILDRLFGY